MDDLKKFFWLLNEVFSTWNVWCSTWLYSTHFLTPIHKHNLKTNHPQVVSETGSYLCSVSFYAYKDFGKIEAALKEISSICYGILQKFSI